SGLHAHGPVLFERDLYRISIVTVFHAAVAVVSTAYSSRCTQGKAGLEFIHTGFGLMLINCGPHVCGPVLVEYVRVSEEDHGVGAEVVVISNGGADGNGKISLLSRHIENRQVLFLPRRNP